MLVAEADGGGSLSEHGLLDLVLVAEEMGRAVAPGPLVPTSVVADTLARHGSDAQRAQWLPGILSGDVVGAWASGDGSIVEAGAQADVFVVTTDGGQRLVPAADAIVTPLGGLDLVRRFARIEIAPDAGEPIGGDGEHELQVAVVLQSAETCGVMQRVFDMTLEYLGDRYSFGRPLASYQALKHRVADNKMHLEASHAIAAAAARAVATSAPDTRREVVSAAKSYIGWSGDRTRPRLRAAPRRHRRDVGARPAPLPATGDGQPRDVRHAARHRERIASTDRGRGVTRDRRRVPPPGAALVERQHAAGDRRPWAATACSGRRDVERDLQRRLWDGGFAGICFPAEYGGLGLSPRLSETRSPKSRRPYDMPLRLQPADVLDPRGDAGRLRHARAEAAPHPGHPPRRRTVGAAAERAERR